MDTLEVPDARLRYETVGNGRVMLLVPGANGSGDAFRGISTPLAEEYTVLTYDRRGFSGSVLVGPQDDAQRLATDADDARRLIEHAGGGHPATVFGTSSGAVVAAEVLTRHPSAVETLVLHEPAAVKLLPDADKWIGFFSELYERYHQSGPAAFEMFREHMLAPSDRIFRPPPDSGQAANIAYWFEHELRQYPAVDLDLDLLRTFADRIVIAAGQESRGYPAHEVSVRLGEELGLEVIELPGGHLGCITHPAPFADGLMRALAETTRRSHGQ